MDSTFWSFWREHCVLKLWEVRKVQYWQLIDIPRPISSYCFYKDICPSLTYTYCSCQYCTYMRRLVIVLCWWFVCWTKEEANGATSAVSRVMAEVTNAVVCGNYTTFQWIHNVTDKTTQNTLCAMFMCVICLFLFAVCPLLGMVQLLDWLIVRALTRKTI